MAELIVALQSLKDGIEELKKEKEVSVLVAKNKKKLPNDGNKETELKIFAEIDQLLQLTCEQLQRWVKNNLQQWQELSTVVEKLKSYQQKKETAYFFDSQS